MCQKKLQLRTISGILVLIVFCFFKCGYKFVDASIPPEVKTIKINNFTNTATLVNPILSVRATNNLIEKIQNQTKLILVSQGKADYEISGTITNYGTSISNISTTTGEAPKSLLNITINYAFVNNLEEVLPNIKNSENSLTVNQEFDGNKALSQVEQELLDNLLKQITDQAFNKIFSSW